MNLPQNKNFRAFLAIDLPGNIKKDIIKITTPLRDLLTSKKIKWVKEENLHLTLFFLGDITHDQYQNIDKKIKELIRDISPFELNFTSLTPFPNREKFHIISFNIEDSDPLKKLADLISQNVSQCKIETEKREFKPHITIARIKRGCKINSNIFLDPRPRLKHAGTCLRGNDAKKVKNGSLIELPPISFKATGVKLFESKLDTKGSIYTPVATYEFAKMEALKSDVFT